MTSKLKIINEMTTVIKSPKQSGQSTSLKKFPNKDCQTHEWWLLPNLVKMRPYLLKT